MHAGPTLTAGLLATAPVCTAVSPFLGDLLVSGSGVDPRRLRVIPNWVDPAPEPCSRSDTGDLLLVHASNFRPVKRAARCADALAVAHAVRPSRLLLVGDGPDRAAVLARAACLGVGDRVDVAGVVDPRTAFSLLAGADAVLLPSSSEACSGVLLQALSAGVPSVAYDVAGNSGVISHLSSGLLVHDEVDGTAFAAAAARLAGSADLRTLLGSGARAAAAAFGRERTVEAYEAAFRAATARRTGRILRAS